MLLTAAVRLDSLVLQGHCKRYCATPATFCTPGGGAPHTRGGREGCRLIKASALPAIRERDQATLGQLAPSWPLAGLANGRQHMQGDWPARRRCAERPARIADNFLAHQTVANGTDDGADADRQ